MRHAKASLSVAMLMLAGASPAGAVDPTALMRKCEQVKAERWDGVTHYVVVQSMLGQQVALPYERFEATGPDGQRLPGFRPMVADSPYASADLRMIAGKAREVGNGLSNEMLASGLPVGMLGDAGEPWASPDPSVMMGGAATFLEAAADAQDANQRERDAAVTEASAAAAASRDMARRMRYVGTESVEGVSTQHLRAEGLGQRHPTGDGGEMVIQDLDLWHVASPEDLIVHEFGIEQHTLSRPGLQRNDRTAITHGHSHRRKQQQAQVNNYRHQKGARKSKKARIAGRENVALQMQNLCTE